MRRAPNTHFSSIAGAASATDRRGHASLIVNFALEEAIRVKNGVEREEKIS